MIIQAVRPLRVTVLGCCLQVHIDSASQPLVPYIWYKRTCSYALTISTPETLAQVNSMGIQKGQESVQVCHQVYVVLAMHICHKGPLWKIGGYESGKSG